jgi:hypothetical protein
MPHTRSLFLAGLLLSLCAAVTLHAQEPNGPSMEKSAASITRAERNPAPLFAAYRVTRHTTSVRISPRSSFFDEDASMKAE